MDNVLWKGLPPEFVVTRYHSLVLTDLPTTLIRTAFTHQHELMAFRHQTLPIWGVQFHPEAALSQYGLELVKNWIDFVSFTYKKTNPTTSLTAQYA